MNFFFRDSNAYPYKTAGCWAADDLFDECRGVYRLFRELQHEKVPVHHGPGLLKVY